MIFYIFKGSGARIFNSLWQSVAVDAPLWPLIASSIRNSLDGLGATIEGLILYAWMILGLEGFHEVAERLEEGNGLTEDLMNSHTLDALGCRLILSRAYIALYRTGSRLFRSAVNLYFGLLHDASTQMLTKHPLTPLESRKQDSGIPSYMSGYYRSS
jgi:hypothetical protein